MLKFFHKNFGSLVLLFFLTATSQGQTIREWKGVDAFWNNATNWDPSGLTKNNYLEFNGIGPSFSTNNNFSPADTIRKMKFSGGTTYTTNGNLIVISNPLGGAFGGLLNTSTVLQTINAPLTFSDNGKFGHISTYSSGNFTIAGNVSLSSTLTELRFSGLNSAGTIRISGSLSNLSGTNPIIIGQDTTGALQTNTGVILEGNNSGFTGNYNIQAGYLRLRSSNSIGSTSTGIVSVFPGATLELDGGITLATRPIHIEGNGLPGLGAIRSVSGTNTISGDILLVNNSRITNSSTSTLTVNNIGRLSAPSRLVFDGTGNINVNGTIGQINGALPITSITKSGAGTLTVNQLCNITEGVVVNTGGTTSSTIGGALQLGGANLFPATASLQLNNASFSTGATVGYSQQFSSLQVAASGSGAIVSSIKLGTGSHTLTFGPSNALSWPTVISHRLIIRGWSGAAGSTSAPGTGKIFVQPDGLNPGLTEAQLYQISFEGFCDGAILLPSGELVPSTLPFISRIDGSPSGGIASAGYVGSTMTLTGCKLNEVTSMTVGGTPITSFTAGPGGTTLTFTLADNVSGLVALTSSSGTRTTNLSVINLDYITTTFGGNPLWSAATGWFPDSPPTPPFPAIVPPADRSVTIIRSRRINAPINNPNTNPAILIKNITLNTSQGVLRLEANNVIPDNAPIRFNGGTLRTSNANTNADTSVTGFNDAVGTIQLTGNGFIALGKGVHTLSFTKSDTMPWTSGRLLTIFNWVGVRGTSGTRGKIFVGNDITGLTKAQLDQINFAGYCAGAKLLSTGELVPSDNPIITSAIGIISGVTGGYIGDTVVINGCNLDSVITVKVGAYVVPDFDLIEIDPDPDPLVTGDEFKQIKFVVDEDTPQDTIILLTGVAGIEGKLNNRLANLGYITKTDGDWNNDLTWLNEEVPEGGKVLTVANNVALDIDLDALDAPDSLIIRSSGTLIMDANRNLTTKHLTINAGGTFVPASGGILNLLPNAVLINNGSFNSDSKGSVNFEGRGTVRGTSRITFHNLTINSDTIFLPRKSSTSTIIPDSIPIITGNLRINGGAFNRFSPAVTDAVSYRQNIGPIYAEGSNLIYSTGGPYNRGIEWNANNLSTALLPWPGLPYNVIIENNTRLNMGLFPTPQPDNLPGPSGRDTTIVIAGSLLINNGRLINQVNRGLEVWGNIEIGNGSTNDSLNLSTADAHPRSNLIVHGDFKRWNNATFSQNNKWLIFGGSADAVLSTPGSAAIFNITRIRINKVGGEVTLQCPVACSTNIDLQGGVVICDATNYFELGATATMTGGNAISFVQGPMRKVTTTSTGADFEFQIGRKVTDASLFYKPVRLGNMSHIGTSVYSAEYFRASTLDPPFVAEDFLDPLLQGLWKDEYWQVNKLSGSGSARVGLPYASGPLWGPTSPVCPACSVAVARYDGGLEAWKFTKMPDFVTSGPYPEMSLTTFSGFVFSDLITTFSPFTIGFGFGSVLPIKLLNFSAQATNRSTVYLQWKVEDENDLKQFELEHSVDGIRFVSIATIDSRNLKEYAYEHKDPGAGKHFYRLLMLEKDGKKSYSRVELAQIGEQKTVITGLIQNPIQGSQAMVRVYSAAAQKADIRIYDASGRLVLTNRIQLQAGDNKASVSVFPLPAGFYRMGIQTQDGVSAFVSMVK